MSGRGITRLSILAVGLRRRLYEFVKERRQPVSRDEAAQAVGVSRKLAAFHLDKMVDAGLLDAHYKRPEGRRGPGAGRPSKFYRPSDEEIEVSIPPRHYDIPGEILLEALETRAPDESPEDAARRVALARGVAIARDAVSARSRPMTTVDKLLRSCGFEPYVDDDGAIRLNNCPFHRLAQRSPEMVCGINRALIEGMLEGAGATDTNAVLEPRPNECCVAIREGTSA